MKWLAALTIVAGCSKGSDPPPPPKPTPTPVHDAAPAMPEVSNEAWWPTQLQLDTGSAYLSIASSPLPTDSPEALWSYLAFVICREDDPYGSFVALGSDARLPTDRERARAGLECGRTVASALPAGSRRHVIELDPAASKYPAPIIAVPTTLSNITNLASQLRGMRREMLGGVELLCRPFDPSEQTCAERANEYDEALAWKDGTLLAGSYVAVSRLLSSSSATHALATIGSVTKRFAGEDQTVELDLLPASTSWTIGPRRWLPYTGESSTVFSSAVRTQARAVGWERSQTQGAILLAPRCSSPACAERDALLAAFREYHTRWKASAPARLTKLLAENPGANADCARAEEEALVTAIARAEVKQTPAGLVELRYVVDEPRNKSAACAARERETSAGAATRVRSLLEDG